MLNRKNLHHQNGAVIIFMALILTVFIVIAVTAINVGRVTIVRNELQNGADAAALAGALCLDKAAGVPGYCAATTTPTDPINWTGASGRSMLAAGINSSDGTALVANQIQYGYWNLTTNSWSSGSPTTGPITSPCPLPPAICTDKPAVKVQIVKNANFFTGTTFNASTTAVAVISNPSSITSSNVIPQVINKCMFDKYWNSSTNQPYNFPTYFDPVTQAIRSDGVDPYSISTAGQPWKLRIGSAYHYGPCVSGQWTCYINTNCSANDVNTNIATNNTTTVIIGDTVYTANGTQASNYKNLNNEFNPTVAAPVNVTVIVINDALSDLIGVHDPIYAFAGFRMTDISQGAKYIQGSFISGYSAPGASGIGPSYGAFTPPRLAQ